MELPNVETLPEATPGERAIMDMHERVLNDLLSELPYEAKLVAVQVLSKHQQKIAMEYVGTDKQVEPAVTELFDVWLRVANNADKTETERTTARRNLIRNVFKTFGFTVKEGETDLKEYVFRAGEALLRRVDDHYRKMGAVAIAKSGDFNPLTIESYEAMEDRSTWSLKQWIEHLGGRQTDDYNIVFGSPLAVDRMLMLHREEMVRQVVLAAHKKII